MAILNTVLPANITEYPNSFKRQGAFPLERYSVFYATETKTAFQEALAYAQSNPIAYVGQVVSVVTVNENIASVDVYKIVQKVTGDSIVHDLELVGDAEAITAANAAIAGLTTRMGTAEGSITSLQEIVNGTGEGEDHVKGLAEKLADAETLLDTVSGTVNEHIEATKDFSTRIAELEASGATKGDVATAKAEAIADAKSETERQIDALLRAYITDDAPVQATDEEGNPLFEEDGVTPIYLPDAVDKLQEIASWIADDKAGAAKIIEDVKAIKDDYLKGSDKTEINGTITGLDQRLSKEIDDLEAYVGTIPEGATSENVVAYIHEVVDALKIGDYAKAQDLIALADRVTALDKADGRIASVESGVNANAVEINTIKGVIGSIPSGNNIAAMLDDKVDKVEGSRLINATEAEILSKLSLNNGQVEIGGTVAAGSITGLPQRIADILDSNEASGVNQEGSLLNGKVDVRHLNSSLTSLITGAVQADKLNVNEFVKDTDGTISLNKVNISKLEQTEGDWLILNGGDSTNDWN